MLVGYKPETEGEDHINAYSKSRTQLGRCLSNFACTPFYCEDGWFDSIEGYWYWLGIAEGTEGRDRLREMSGFQAKQEGRKLKAPDWPLATLEFKRKIRSALACKLQDFEGLEEMLKDSGDLPIVHYYVYGTPRIIHEPVQGMWIWKHWEILRADSQGRNP